MAETMPLVTGLGERAERAADGDRRAGRPGSRRESPIGGGRQAGRVDLDDGEVGQGVDAVDRRRERAAVLELDRQLLRVAGDDVVVGQDQPLASKMTPEPDAVPWPAGRWPDRCGDPRRRW